LELRCRGCQFPHLRKGSEIITGDNDGDDSGVLNRGVGSRVESADAPVSPLKSPPRLLDVRRTRGMFAFSGDPNGVLCVECCCRDAAAKDDVVRDMLCGGVVAI